MAFTFVLPAMLDGDLFAKAWRHVVTVNDILRLTIPATADRGIAWRLHADPPETEIHRHDDKPPGVAEFLDWARARCARPLDLSRSLVDSVLVPLEGGRSGWYLNQHHLITDARSTELLVQQVNDAYLALARGEDPEAKRHADYFHVVSRDNRGRFPAPSTANEPSPRTVDIPSKRGLYGRATGKTGPSSTRITRVLDDERSERLEKLKETPGFASLSPDVARFNVLATLLVALQHRLGSSESHGFTTPHAGRTSLESRTTLGCFIQLFPYQVDVQPGDTFRDVALRCQEETLNFLGKPLHAASDIASARSTAQVVLNYLPIRFSEIGGIRPDEVQWLHPGHSDPNHALRLQVHDFTGSGNWTLHFDCNDDALPSPWRERLPDHLERLLDAMLEDPDRPIDGIDLLLEEERAQLDSINETNRSPLPSLTVWHRIEEMIRNHPDHVILREAHDSLTYAELGRRVQQIADVLDAHGISAGDRVVVTGARTTALVVAVLAVMRQGGAYVPVHASAPSRRLAEILSNSGARLILDSSDPSKLSIPAGVAVVDLTKILGSTATSELQPVPGPSLDDEAYLIYTSGSTGKPKGVVINHLGLADYLAWAEAEYVHGALLRVPLFTSLAFDLTVTSLYLPLLTRGVLDIYPESGDGVDTAVLDVIERSRVDLIKLTPSHLSLLLRHGIQDSGIRRMILGGEDLPTHSANSAMNQLSGALELINEYGPTEAVVGCVAHRFDPERDRSPSVPIGKPVDHVAVEIRNTAGVPVPIGVPGELWLSRPGLALRYEGMADLTAASFIADANLPDRRRYRTGDRVRVNEHGELVYLGRLDRQVKISGHRVEPGEVENVLRSLDEIDAAAVVVRDQDAPDPGSQPVKHCVRCGLASNVPRTALDEEGVCSVCRTFEAVKDSAAEYFREERDLRALFEASRRDRPGEYDCMMLYSGGKDSSYALARLVDMGLRVYAFTLDNGYISDDAKTNIREMTAALDVPVEFATTPAMNQIFRDSLERFSNVCNGCFKTIYTLSMIRAHELGIPVIVTGLSRGQMFETRLTEDLFTSNGYSPDQVDDAVLAARKTYHRLPDAVTRLLDTRLFERDDIFDEIQIVDFYRYVDVGLDEVYRYLDERVPWVRPRDTGRSTNCLINDVGIAVHQKERGFHNYALPYSWDVRMGHKTREAALEELNDDIDPRRVGRILQDIDYQVAERVNHTGASLEAFFVSDKPQDVSRLRSELGKHLPPAMIPVRMVQVESLPLAPSGKIDEAALLVLPQSQPEDPAFRPPEGPVQSYLADLWQRELKLERVGLDDHFFELGGSSLIAMQVMIQLCREFTIELPLETLFQQPVLGDLAFTVEEKILSDVEG
jgi:amino acid adenylation domain-containing protein